MGLDLGEVAGALVLHDAWNSVLAQAREGVSAFVQGAKETFPAVGDMVDDNEIAFTAMGAAITTVTAAVAGLIAGTTGLALRGADILDVSGTLEHFSGSAIHADANLDGLRKGVQGTVDDMALMQDAARVLSAGVKLNADDFETLGAAAFTLQNRGLGSTKDMLEMVSDAMITGRTRALAMKLGVIDLGDAHENYAKKMGVEVEMLSESAKAAANREQVMKMLGAAVKDAGEQEKDFGEKLDTALASFQNWLDDLAVAVTQSPVLAAAVEEIGNVLTDAFGSNQADLIETIVGWIEKGLIITADLGLATVEAVRVMYTGWKGIELVVLATTGAITMGVAGIAAAVAGITGAAAAMPFATEGMKAAAEAAGEFAISLQETVVGLGAQADEAAQAVIGNSDFHRTLDDVGGALFRVRDAMVDASNQKKESTTTTNNLNDAVARAKKTQDEETASLIDATKARKLQEEGLKKARELWDEYHALVDTHSKTSTDKQIADVQRWKESLIREYKEAGKDTKEFYEALEALSREKTKSVIVDWDAVKGATSDALKEARDRAVATYEAMKERIADLRQGELQKQLEKVRETELALRTMGREGVAAEQAMQKETEKAIATRQKEIEATREAERAQRALRNAASVSFDITKDNLSDVARTMGVDVNAIIPFLKKGYSFMQAVQAARNPGYVPDSPGPRVPGFQTGVRNFEGGPAWVGEGGPELAFLPKGTSVIPQNQVAGITQINHINITAPTNEMARMAIRELDRLLQTRRS
jgi:hypothetical protein